MQFLTSEGKIFEGQPLTDEQVKQRVELVEYFHLEVCNSSYHSRYDTDKKCETLANFFITKFELLPREGVSLANEMAALLPQVEPEPPEAITLSPEAQKAYDDEIPL